MSQEQLIKDLHVIPKRFLILIKYLDCSIWEEKELEYINGDELVYMTIKRWRRHYNGKDIGEGKGNEYRHSFTLKDIQQCLEDGTIKLITDDREWWFERNKEG